VEPGALVRFEICNQTEEGILALPYKNSGKQIPPELSSRILEKTCKDKESWIIYRGALNVEEAEALYKANLVPDLYIVIETPEETLIERAKYRRVDPKTHLVYNLKEKVPQDEEIKKRLIIKFGDDEIHFKQRITRYKQRILPILDFYRTKGVLISHIDGSKSQEEIFTQIKSILLLGKSE